MGGNRQAGVQHSHLGPLSRGVPGPFRPSNAQVEAWKKGTVRFVEKLRCGHVWKVILKPSGPCDLLQPHPQDSESGSPMPPSLNPQHLVFSPSCGIPATQALTYLAHRSELHPPRPRRRQAQRGFGQPELWAENHPPAPTDRFRQPRGALEPNRGRASSSKLPGVGGGGLGAGAVGAGPKATSVRTSWCRQRNGPRLRATARPGALPAEPGRARVPEARPERHRRQPWPRPGRP